MKRKLAITLALTIGCSGVAYAGYEPVRTMLGPTLHQLNLTDGALHLKPIHGAVDSAVENAAANSKDATLEPDRANVQSASKESHKVQHASEAQTSQQAAKPAPSAPKSQPKPAPKPATPASAAPPAPAKLSDSAELNVPAISQEPELYNGCEVTSLSMLLSAAGHPVDKMTLANMVKKDPTPATYDNNNNITAWGDPNSGFVGDVSGNDPGYGVYHGPVTQLLNSILPGRAEDLSGSEFTQVLSRVASGHPVVAWTTATFTPTSDWTTWQGPNGQVKATFDEHVVLIVGYNSTQIFLNDPLDGIASKAVNRAQFISAWQQLGDQAVTYKG